MCLKSKVYFYELANLSSSIFEYRKHFTASIIQKVVYESAVYKTCNEVLFLIRSFSAVFHLLTSLPFAGSVCQEDWHCCPFLHGP